VTFTLITTDYLAPEGMITENIRFLSLQGTFHSFAESSLYIHTIHICLCRPVYHRAGQNVISTANIA